MSLPLLFLPGSFPLYFVTDHFLNGGRTKIAVIEAALRGGVRLIQYRDKELSDADFESEARQALALCRNFGATLLVNDRVHIAARIGADGVHLGQADMAPGAARNLLGPKAVIGLSTHDERELRGASKQGLSYLNIGPIFSTQTKAHLHSLGVDEVLRLARLCEIPWTTMGGIKHHHLADLFRRGVKTVAMVTEISLAGNVEESCRQLLSEIDRSTRLH